MEEGTEEVEGTEEEEEREEETEEEEEREVGQGGRLKNCHPHLPQAQHKHTFRSGGVG